MSDSLWTHGLYPARLLCPWDSPGKNTGVGCHFLLQGIFLTQELNPSLLHWQVGSSPLAPPRKPHGVPREMLYLLQKGRKTDPKAWRKAVYWLTWLKSSGIIWSPLKWYPRIQFPILYLYLLVLFTLSSVLLSSKLSSLGFKTA